jgi:hypothetical protein
MKGLSHEAKYVALAKEAAIFYVDYSSVRGPKVCVLTSKCPRVTTAASLSFPIPAVELYHRVLREGIGSIRSARP